MNVSKRLWHSKLKERHNQWLLERNLKPRMPVPPIILRRHGGIKGTSPVEVMARLFLNMEKAIENLG